MRHKLREVIGPEQLPVEHKRTSRYELVEEQGGRLEGQAGTPQAQTSSVASLSSPGRDTSDVARATLS